MSDQILKLMLQIEQSERNAEELDSITRQLYSEIGRI